VICCDNNIVLSKRFRICPILTMVNVAFQLPGLDMTSKISPMRLPAKTPAYQQTYRKNCFPQACITVLTLVKRQ
jgi:hypothetical protein